MEEEWENWSKLIKSTVVSSKRLLTPREINRDMYEIDGRNIPYKQMGYSSLEELLNKIGGLKVFQLNGQTVVQAMANEKTAHIQKMIQCQKKPKKKHTLPYAPNTFNMNKQPIKSQLSMSYKKVTNVPVNRCNQNSHNLSSRLSFTPKVTSTPTSVIRKPVQISQQQHQNHQQQPSSFKNNIQFAPKPNLQEPSPSAQLLSSIENPISDSVPDSVPQQLALYIPQRIHILTDPRKMLKFYCKKNNLEKPVYSVHKNVYSSVMVNSKKYYSYPREAASKDEAEIFAAEAALKELCEKDMSSIVTSDQAFIVKRIVDMVKAHPNGVFESRVVELYFKEYKENLPSNWLKLVEHLISVDVCANNFIILRPAKACAVLEPENLKLNVEEFWLQVYNVDSTTSIWGLILDGNHSDKIFKLAQEMKVLYDKKESNASLVAVGKHYAVFDSAWHRVRCIKLDEEIKTATVFFIDRGDEDVVLTSRLRVLHSEFCRLPAQALCLSLAGLEIFQDCEKAKILLEQHLVDKRVYVRIVRNNERLVRNTGVLSAELFFERNGNVNRFIKSEILTNSIFMTANIQDEWQRVRIMKIENVDTAQVKCVDVGNTVSVKRNNLVLLEELSEILTEYPKQAVQVRLHKISTLMFNEKMGNRLPNLAPKTDVFYAKVVSFQDVPKIEFYKKIDNNYLASLNDTLALDT